MAPSAGAPRTRARDRLGLAVVLGLGLGACKGPGYENVAWPWSRPLPSLAAAGSEPVMEARRATDPGTGRELRKWYVLAHSDGTAVLHGPDTGWYPDGTPRHERSWHEGLPDGRDVRRYPDGSVEVEREWDRGRRVGTWRRFWPDGTPRSEVPMEGAGVARFWHENGRLAAEGPQVDGERRGRWRYWTESGAPRAVEAWAAERGAAGAEPLEPPR